MLDDDGDVDDEFLTWMTSDNGGKLHPVKMEAYQVFNNFDEFGNVHTDMVDKIPKGQELDRSKIDSGLDLPEDGIDNTTLYFVKLPSVMPVHFENNLFTTKFCSKRDVDK
eukprot:11272986-Ditylum_brightwellii.AAC.1